ncbi:MAG: TetR/AcrR family transcriptional regulator [Candidatus Nanohaloarchaea archaeon]
MSARKSGEERKREILDSALSILHEEGASSLTVRNIAERVDISEPAVYRHFDSKEEIVRELAEKVFEKERIPEMEEAEDASELVSTVLREIFSGLEDNPEITVLFRDELFREFPRVQEIFERHRREKREKLEGIIEEAQERGQVSEDVDAEVFALILMGSVRMAVKEWAASDFSYSLTDRAEPIAGELGRILESGG